ncbi:MAG: Ig-like domain-containing protein [Actinobacteria bacterium]|nr:Ig-like domain-containing protein [Actinomycetota bacterium]
MEIRQLRPLCLRSLKLLIAVFLIITGAQGSAAASQVIVNGSFEKDLGEWRVREVTKGAVFQWDEAGAGADGGALFKTTGRSRRGETQASQNKWVHIESGSRGLLRFSWKKNWSAILPIEHKVYVNLIKPDQTVASIWSNKTLLNDNTWRVESIDVSRFLDQKGQYSLVVGASFENGKANNAATYAWFDNVSLEVSNSMLKGPKTSFLMPSGRDKIVGKTYLVTGIAHDDIGVSKVRVAIERLYDNTYWNGNSWVATEFWNEAKSSGSSGNTVASWRYKWQLPTSDGALYRLYARTENITSNTELTPAESIAQVDNVGPTGSIYVEGEAEYVNTEAVRIDIDIKGATKMRFSADDAKTWFPWESYKASKKLTLPEGDDTKIVTAQFKDDSGNSYQISDSIILDTTQPVTRHIFPAQKAKNISTDSSVGVVFYEKMAPWSFRNDGTELGSTFYLKQGSRWVAAKVSYDDKTKTAKLVPYGPLDSGTTYTVHLKDLIKDKAGNSLAANFSWDFTTSGSYTSLFKETVGAVGGTIHGGDQSISLEVPADALTAETLLTIEELRDKKVPPMKGMTRYSPVYQLSPKELPFNTAALLKIKYRQDEVHNPTELRLVSFDEEREKWLPVQNAVIDLVNSQITAKITKLMTVTVTAQDDASPPSTTIIAPTGASEITGRLFNIFGVSRDNSGIARLDISIRRQSDNAYWTGSEWQPTEVWLKTKVVTEKDRSKATWSYGWRLPDNKFTVYEIRARATDKSGNVESNADLVRVRLR